MPIDLEALLRIFIEGGQEKLALATQREIDRQRAIKPPDGVQERSDNTRS
jgi:hypothetical protein